MALTLRGAFTALITPFRDGQVDEPALRALVDRQIDGGINGLVPCGTTGESATMSTQEQLRVIQIVVEQAAGRVPVIAGTGSNDTARTIAYTREVAAIGGVDAALVVCPYYNKPNQAMLLRHFHAVADQSALPVVLYNVPGRTVISIAPETIAALAEHEQIVAVKEATGDMAFAARLMELLGDRPFDLLSGDDFTTMPFVAMGGHGCISVVSNLDPGVMARICALTASGELAQARALNVKIQALARALFKQSNPVPAKAIAASLGWCTDEVRAPLYPLDDAERAALRPVIEAYGAPLSR